MQDLLRILVLVVATVIGVGGVAIMFGAAKKHIGWGVLSAVICCVAYEVCLILGWGLFIASLVASVATTAYSYVMARILRIPATFMTILGILPLVPGARLYYTMLGLVNSEMDTFYYYGETVLLIAAGLAVGIIAVTAIFRPINSMMKRMRSAG